MAREPGTVNKADALAEAYKRGLLPPDKKAAYEEAQRRGLVGGAQSAPQAAAPKPVAPRTPGGGFDMVPSSPQARRDMLTPKAAPQPMAAAPGAQYSFQPTPEMAASAPMRAEVQANNEAQRAKGLIPLTTEKGTKWVADPAKQMGDIAAQQRLDRESAERREAAAAYGAGQDMIITQDQSGQLRPGSAADDDISKAILTSPQRAINAGIGAGEAMVNIIPDTFNAMADQYYRTGNTQDSDQVRAPRAAIPRAPIPEGMESMTGDLAQGLAQFLISRKAVGSAAPGGGTLAQVGKDALAVGAGFDGSTGRVADMLDLNAIPEGPLRDYAAWLQTQPEDSQLVGRFKNLLEDMTFSGPAVAPQLAVRGVQAVGNAVMPKPMPPANAGGAGVQAALAQSRVGGAVPPPQAAAQAAPQPSLAPVQQAPRSPVQTATQTATPPAPPPPSAPASAAVGAATPPPPGTITPVPANAAVSEFNALPPKVRESFILAMRNSGMPRAEIDDAIRSLNDLPPGRANQFEFELLRRYGGPDKYPNLRSNLTSMGAKWAIDPPKSSSFLGMKTNVDGAQDVMNAAMREQIGSEGVYLQGQAERLFGEGRVTSNKDLASFQTRLGSVYNTVLSKPYGRTFNKMGPARKAAEAQRIDAARGALSNYLKSPDVMADVPDWVRRDVMLRVSDDLRRMDFPQADRAIILQGNPELAPLFQPAGRLRYSPELWNTLVDLYPTQVGHSLQSAYREAIDKALKGTDAGQRTAAKELMRLRGQSRVRANAANPDERGFGLLYLLEDAVPGYKELRQKFGDVMGAQKASEMPKQFFAVVRDEEALDDFIRVYDEELTPLQREAVENGITTEIRQALAKKVENVAPWELDEVDRLRIPNLTKLSDQSVIDALPRIFGDKGQQMADAILLSRANLDNIGSINKNFASGTPKGLAISESADRVYENPRGLDGNVFDKTSQIIGGSGAAVAFVPGAQAAAIPLLGLATAKVLLNAYKAGKRLTPRERTQLAEFLFRSRQPIPPGLQANASKRADFSPMGYAGTMARDAVVGAGVAAAADGDIFSNDPATLMAGAAAGAGVGALRTRMRSNRSLVPDAPRQPRGRRSPPGAAGAAVAPPTQARTLPGQTARSPAVIGGAAVGAVTGAAMNPDDPATGALIGAGVGGLGVGAVQLGNRLAKLGSPKPKAVKPPPGGGSGFDADGFDTSRVFYHGTGQNFSAFDRKGALGVHIGTREQAKTVADSFTEHPQYGKSGGPKPIVMPVYGRIKKSIELPDLQDWYAPDVAFYLKKMGIDVKPSDGKVITTEDVRNALLERGYDAVRYRNKWEGQRGKTSYIILDPANIRRADAATPKPPPGAGVKPPPVGAKAPTPPFKPVEGAEVIDTSSWTPAVFTSQRIELGNMMRERPKLSGQALADLDSEITSLRQALGMDGASPQFNDVPMASRFNAPVEGMWPKGSPEEKAIKSAIANKRWTTEPVPASKIIPTQDSVFFDYAKAAGRYAGDDRLPIMVKQGDQYFVADGHHRLMAQAGKDVVNARVIDLAPSAGTGGKPPPAQAGFGGSKPLPMDEASRMQRAREMGFDVDTPLYVSALKDVEQFDKHGKFMGHKGISGISLTDNPKMAERYLARYNERDYKGEPFKKNMMKVYIRPGRVLEMDKPFNSGIGTGFPLPEGYKWPKEFDGYDTIIFPDAISSRGGVRHLDPDTFEGRLAGREFIVRDPSQVRVSHAAFDPSQEGSSKLLAGMGGKTRGVIDNLKQDAAIVGATSIAASANNPDDPAALGIPAAALLIGGKYGARLGNGLKRGPKPPPGARRFKAPEGMTFAGVNAKTADRVALARAEQMAKEGASRDEIWDATGWFKGVDGKWRFEIDDSGASIKRGVTDKYLTMKPGDGTRRPLGEVMDHPELYKAYPDLATRNADVGRLSRGAFGEYDYGKDTFGMYSADPSMIRSGLLHEAGGHGVQAREGFAAGGSPENMLMDELKAINDEMSKLARQMDVLRKNKYYSGRPPKDVDAEVAALKQQYDDLMDRRSAEISPAAQRDAYNRLAGEAEARNVQTRDAMRTRGEKPGRPWETQDVPDDRQLVRFRAEGGKAESRPKPPPAQSGFGGGKGTPRPPERQKPVGGRVRIAPGVEVLPADPNAPKPPKRNKGAYEMTPSKDFQEQALRKRLRDAQSAYTKARSRHAMRDNREDLWAPYEQAELKAAEDLAAYLEQKAAKTQKSAAMRDRYYGLKDYVNTEKGGVAIATGLAGAAGLGTAGLVLANQFGGDDKPKERPKKPSAPPMNPKDPRFYWERIVAKDKQAVAEIQDALAAWGNWPEEVEANGVLGDYTEAGIRWWRHENGLDPEAPMTRNDVARLLAGPKGYEGDGGQWGQKGRWYTGDGGQPRVPQ